MLIFCIFSLENSFAAIEWSFFEKFALSAAIFFAAWNFFCKTICFKLLETLFPVLIRIPHLLKAMYSPNCFHHFCVFLPRKSSPLTAPIGLCANSRTKHTSEVWTVTAEAVILSCENVVNLSHQCQQLVSWLPIYCFLIYILYLYNFDLYSFFGRRL